MNRSLFIFILLFSFGMASANKDADVLSFEKSISRCIVPASNSKPTLNQLKLYCSELMVIKNGLSLLRDGKLNQETEAKLKYLIQAHISFGESAMSAVGSVAEHKMARLIFYHALHADRATKFSKAMEIYHQTTGYESYTAAQDLGIDQIWEW